ncbi:MAG TPA: hypothetical protein VEG60_01975 [Candidatus Binatia bacterium]|nr:hypothetical protein [Candidatus Binatia bacterium]
MATYRARHCPRCSYYLGFSIAKSPLRSKESSITSFCLNCGYKLPINRIIRGIRRTVSPLRRAALRLASIKNHERATGSETPNRLQEEEEPLSPVDYSRHLRVIGQELETLRLKTFNLECMGDAYLVWSPSGMVDSEGHTPSHLGKNPLQKLWKKKSQSRSHGQVEHLTLPPSQRTKRYSYSLRDIESMEYESRRQRHRKPSITDGHSLSQLLRTAGAVVGQRRERLLAISWQELSISIVVETAKGQRQIDVFRPDNLYDLWVRMYLRRNHRALSDFPR